MQETPSAYRLVDLARRDVRFRWSVAVLIVAASYILMVIARALAMPGRGGDFSYLLAFIVVPALFAMTFWVLLLSPKWTLAASAVLALVAYVAIGMVVAATSPFLEGVASGGVFLWPYLLFAALGCHLPGIGCSGI